MIPFVLEVAWPPARRPSDRGGLDLGAEFLARWGWSRYSVWEWECICAQLSDRLIVSG